MKSEYRTHPHDKGMPAIHKPHGGHKSRPSPTKHKGSSHGGGHAGVTKLPHSAPHAK